MLVLGTLSLSAQQGGESPGEEEKFSFGPPLRENILFAYKYTERVRAWYEDDKGKMIDSCDRTLIYYITEMQRPSPVGGGAYDIETNIDSMKVDYRGAGGSIDFNTQDPSHVTDYSRIRHPAILVPSTLVSSVTHFTVSPYGGLVGMESPSFDKVREQAEDPYLDEFTYKRIDHMIDKRFLSTIFLPWRNLLPLGREILYNTPVKVPFYGTLDRITFDDSATVTLRYSKEDPSRPHLEFEAPLSDPVVEWMTFDGIAHPLLLKEAAGDIQGRLHLDQDGVVLSGFSTAAGKVEGSFEGKKTRARFEHQVFVELINMTNFPVN